MVLYDYIITHFALYPLPKNINIDDFDFLLNFITVDNILFL